MRRNYKTREEVDSPYPLREGDSASPETTLQRSEALPTIAGGVVFAGSRVSHPRRKWDTCELGRRCRKRQLFYAGGTPTPPG